MWVLYNLNSHNCGHVTSLNCKLELSHFIATHFMATLFSQSPPLLNKLGPVALLSKINLKDPFCLFPVLPTTWTLLRNRTFT